MWPYWKSRIKGRFIGFTTRQTLSDSSPCNQNTVRTNFEMSCNSNLSCHRDKIANIATTSNGGISNDDTMLPNDYVMTHLTQVINFSTLTNLSFTETASINRAVRSNLHIIFYFDISKMNNFLMLGSIKLITKAIRSDYSSTMHDHIFS